MKYKLIKTWLIASVFVGGLGGCASTSNVDSGITIKRLPANPIITTDILPGKEGSNIGGPSLIRVPKWVKNPLGKYYLYFAHHHGHYIRMAYADKLAGPWKLYKPGTLKQQQTVCDDIHQTKWAKKRHIASPDVLVDETSKTIRMYYHCPAYIKGPKDKAKSYRQVTFVATSKDGLKYQSQKEVLGNPFFRVFNKGGSFYALAMPGLFYRSADGLHNFKPGPAMFKKYQEKGSRMRHSAVMQKDGKLLVFYTNIGDNPERILLSTISLNDNWMDWQESKPMLILAPEEEWEGGNLPLKASVKGPAKVPVRQLRDPAIFIDEGRTYLLYSIAGEQGIAIAEIQWPE